MVLVVTIIDVEGDFNLVVVVVVVVVDTSSDFDLKTRENQSLYLAHEAVICFAANWPLLPLLCTLHLAFDLLAHVQRILFLLMIQNANIVSK